MALGRSATVFGMFCALCVSCDDSPSESALFPASFESTYTLVRDCRFSIDHGGASISVWASPDGAAAYQAGTYPLPPNTVLVKKLHVDAACKELEGFVAMKKVAGDTWVWQTLDEKGSVTGPDTPRTCITCHNDCTEGRDLTCTDP